MAAVETYKQVFLFYQAPCQSNVDYLEAFKTHIKENESHNVAVGHHMGLSAVSLQEKYNITRDTANSGQKIEVNIKAIEIYVK